MQITSAILGRELERLQARLESEIVRLKAEMYNDPTNELIDVQLEFHNFLSTTQGKEGARSTPEASRTIDSLHARKKRAEERSKMWSYDKLMAERIEHEFALEELRNLLFHRILGRKAS